MKTIKFFLLLFLGLSFLNSCKEEIIEFEDSSFRNYKNYEQASFALGDFTYISNYEYVLNITDSMVDVLNINPSHIDIFKAELSSLNTKIKEHLSNEDCCYIVMNTKNESVIEKIRNSSDFELLLCNDKIDNRTRASNYLTSIYFYSYGGYESKSFKAGKQVNSQLSASKSGSFSITLGCDTGKCGGKNYSFISGSNSASSHLVWSANSYIDDSNTNWSFYVSNYDGADGSVSFFRW